MRPGERMAKMKKLVLFLGVILCLGIAARVLPAYAQQIDRTQLPIPDTQYKYPGKIPLDARDAKFPPIKPLRPPQGAPNVVVILLDDIGFGAPSTFGGGINMPTLDSLAKSGLRYTQFHTTALCSPTREALLTGHNHHSVGMGAITELATSAPGYNSIRPNRSRHGRRDPQTEWLQHRGLRQDASDPGLGGKRLGTVYALADRRRFREVLRFSWRRDESMGAADLRWSHAVVEPPHTPGYNFMTDMTDHAIAWMRFQHTMTPDKPFFIYFAPGRPARAAPHSAGMARQVQGQIR